MYKGGGNTSKKAKVIMTAALKSFMFNRGERHCTHMWACNYTADAYYKFMLSRERMG